MNSKARFNQPYNKQDLNLQLAIILFVLQNRQLIFFSIYLSANNIGPTWLGVKKIEGTWYKANMEKLHEVDLDVLNENESDGECMILGNFDGHVQGKIVDCTESYSVSFFYL